MANKISDESYIHGRAELATTAMASRVAGREAGFFMPYLKPGMDLLDGGCGPGTITAGLAASIAPGSVTAMDISEQQVKIAETNCTEAGSSNVEFRIGSLTDLPFDNGTFDAAFTHMVVEHIADSEKAISEIYRVLKPGGVYGARHSVSNGSVRYPLPPKIMAKIQERHYADWDDGRGSSRFGELQTGLMINAGFGIDRISSSSQHFDREQLSAMVPNVDAAIEYYRPQIESPDEEAQMRQEVEEVMSNPNWFLAALAIETVGIKPR